MLIRNHRFDFENHTYIMGILNVTPDSFSDGGEHNEIDAAIACALKMIEEGATIIDIGGESTRPGYTPVSVEDELNRVIPVIKGIRAVSDIVISVDTMKAEVARQSVIAGADIVNDVSGCLFDSNMARVISELNVPCILMHDGQYFDHTDDDSESEDEYIDKIVREMNTITDKAISSGIDKDKIIIDPGVGFGKTVRENLLLIKKLDAFINEYPVLLGCSRKSVIGKTLDVAIDERLAGTITTSVVGAQNGAGIVRVHDVKDNYMAIKMYEAIKEAI